MDMQKSILYPPKKIGIIGGGQLGRMLTMEAKRMGYHVTVLDPNPKSPAGQVSDLQIHALFSDAEQIEYLAKATDVITYEFEHINANILCELQEKGHRIIPSGHTLMNIQDKFKQKSLLMNRGLPVPKVWKIKDIEDVERIIREHGLPIFIKSSYGAYDGKGNYLINSKEDALKALEVLGSHPFYAEAYMDFEKEISVMVAVDAKGNKMTYPLADNLHQDSILRLTKVPADVNDDIENQALIIVEQVLDLLNDCGVFCIEMFLDHHGKLYINEIAPRPHNSGHYTIEACYTSQYEQLLRVMTGMPLGSTELRSPCAMINILGKKKIEAGADYIVDGINKVLNQEKLYIHLYGKDTISKLKKLGHITVLSDKVECAEKTALEAEAQISVRKVNNR